MATYTQQNRRIQLETPLGKDVLLLTGFTGYEEMSRLFSFRLEMLSTNKAIAAKDIVGKKVSFKLLMPDDSERHFSGFVSRFSNHGGGDRLASYSMEVVPWLWFLTQTSDCRIFQDKTAPDIIKQVFADLGFSDFEFKVSGTHPQREYCVQYRETDFNFVSRLMEEEGIFYYFKHSAGKHTLVLTDHKGGYGDAPEKARFMANLSDRDLYDNITAWEHRMEFRPGKTAHTDYHFETPSTSLMSKANTIVKLPGNDKFELYDYPGEYTVKGDGDALVKVRMEEQEAPHDVVSAASRCRTFSPGLKFTVEEHHVGSEKGKKYLLTAVQHQCRMGAYLVGDEAITVEYNNTFTCIPETVTFRPARITPRPSVPGLQTAVVVGPAGEEIYTDKYGRIKVQFHWDREGKKDEKSSCFVRVGQPWAGKNWGFQFIPRIGHEVVVHFIEGDPDRPLVMGSVYHAENMPPLELTANQTQSGIKTHSTKGGGADNFNQLRFEDKKGNEEIYFHAEKDFNRVVENNDTTKVGFEKKDKGDQCIEIFNNQNLKVGCSQASDGSQTIEVWKNRTETVKTGNEKVTIESGNRDIEVSKGNDTHKIKMGNRDVQIDMGNDALTIKMGNKTTKLNLGKCEEEAMQSIELKVGQSSIKIDQMGVTIKGMMVTVESQMITEIKGLMTEVKGTAMVKAAGAITMIG